MENIHSNHMLQNENVAQDKAAWQQYCNTGVPNNSHMSMLSGFIPQYQFIVLVFSNDKIPAYSSTRTAVQHNYPLPRKLFFPQ
jgi:hypothetical protein